MVNLLWDNIFKRDKEKKDISTILAGNYLFENLSPRELVFVQDIIHARNYRPGEVIFSQGEAGVGMYIIVKGAVNMTVEDLHSSENANRVFVTRLGQSDFFGEIALVEKNSRRTATATAVDEVTLLGFFKPDLYEIIDRNPRTGVKIVTRLAEVLGRRLRETAESFSELKREIKNLKSN